MYTAYFLRCFVFSSIISVDWEYLLQAVWYCRPYLANLVALAYVLISPLISKALIHQNLVKYVVGRRLHYCSTYI